MESDFVELSLVCANRDEANIIANRLLERKLVTCVKFLPVDSRYWWNGKIIDDHEILLLMETVAEKFDEIEGEVAELHSYDTFVLEQFELGKISSRATVWLTKTLTTN